MCLPPPVNQSTPPSISSISLQRSSDLDTDQGDIIDETIKQVAQLVNHTLCKTSTGNSISTLSQNDSLNDNVTNVQSTHNLNTSANTQPGYTQQPVSSKNSITHPDTSFEQTKQIKINTDALSHLPTLKKKTKFYRN